MRIAGLLCLVPTLMLAYCIAWMIHPRRRLAGSAVLAGLVVGRVAAGTAW